MLLSLISMLETLKSWPNSFQSFLCFWDTKNRSFAVVSHAPWKTTCLLSTANLDISFMWLFSSIEEIQEPCLSQVWRMCGMSLEHLGQDGDTTDESSYIAFIHTQHASATFLSNATIKNQQKSKQQPKEFKKKLEERPIYHSLSKS